MPGGTFGYREHANLNIADDIEVAADHQPPEIAQKFREAAIVLRRAFAYAHRVDGLLASDYDHETFLERLNGDLDHLENLYGKS